MPEALSLLGEASGGRRPLAYGTDLLVWAKTGVSRPEGVIDLSALEELSRLEATGEGLILGAGRPLAELGRDGAVRARFPALAQALTTMGSVQLREGASLGGNVCTASPAGDTAPPLLVYEAVMVVAGPGGERALPASELYLGPGRTALEPGELLREVRLPWPPDGCVGIFLKGARRAAVDLALVSVAAVAFPDAAAASGLGARFALGAVAPTPIRAPAAEALVRDRGLPADPGEPLARELTAAVRAAAQPIDDARATADYRRELVGVLAARAAAALRAEMVPAAKDSEVL